MDETTLVDCAYCGAPAEVVEVVVLGSTDSQMPHHWTVCALGHQRLAPARL